MSPGLDIDREPRAPRNDDLDDDFDPSRIPNPLEQTFDKRFVQNPRMPPGGRGFRSGGGGFGAGGSAPPAASPKKGNGPREPDPMQTSVGYIGGDAFHRKSSRGNGGQGGQGGGQPGGGGRGGPRGGGFGGGRRGR
jgi:23S rRNA pseudouridine2605 synthase